MVRWGSIAYYLFYEWVHLAHHTPAYRPRTRRLSIARCNMRHHFHNENYNKHYQRIGRHDIGHWKHLTKSQKAQPRVTSIISIPKTHSERMTHMSEISIGLIGGA